MGFEATDRRLREQVLRRLEPDERVLAWARAWVSPTRTHQWLAPRHRDFVIVTNRRLMLWAAAHWTRRPRRRILTERLDTALVVPIPADDVRTVHVTLPERKPLVIEFGKSPQARSTAFALVEQARRAATGDPDAVQREPLTWA
jgi:hypothetical protein